MELIHNFDNKIIRKTVDGSDGKSLMLARGGSYLWIGQDPSSRYQGWFFGCGDNRLLKIIEDVRVENAGEIVAMENGLRNVKRISQNSTEKFSFLGDNCLVYETGKPEAIEIFFDIKESYENSEFGRRYNAWQEDGLLFISYRGEGQSKLPEIFIAICGDIVDYDLKREWLCRDYGFDRERGSAPWKRWVFKPAVLRASKLVFAVAFDKNGAETAARNYWRGLGKSQILNQEKCKVKESNNSEEAAKICAQKALKMLLGESRGSVGLRAGLPWFFQFWQRDEAVSLRELAMFDEKAAMDIFWRQLKQLDENDFNFDSADGAGWLFFRAPDSFRRGKFHSGEISFVRDYLVNAIDYLLKNNTWNNLAIHDAGKTWMDSLGRAGAAIEIQALRLAMYSFAADLAVDESQKNNYLKLKNDLKREIRMIFFERNRLADAFDKENNSADFTIRPNIFLAAYIYPDLLSKKEWSAVISHALGKLWFDWGGLSTIDKADARFVGRDTGENPASYHNGDSWFYINNIAAIVMNRIDPRKFNKYINKIFQASINDILWNGAIGCASEISSAQLYHPAGCANQAWSNATFLELYRELK